MGGKSPTVYLSSSPNAIPPSASLGPDFCVRLLACEPTTKYFHTQTAVHRNMVPIQDPEPLVQQLPDSISSESKETPESLEKEIGGGQPGKCATHWHFLIERTQSVGHVPKEYKYLQ